jgi:pilus assembly protein CpaB
MRNTSITVLIASLVMAALAALLVHNWLQARPSTGTIVVAAKGLSFGTELTTDNILTIEWPAGKLPKGAFTTKQALLKAGGRYVLTSMEPNEPVLESKITGPGQRGALSALLEGDMRAVTVRVDDVRGVAGFVLPGDRVDVVLIRTHGTDGKSYADVIVQNVKVLAVDQKANEKPDKANVVAKAVTVAVNSEDAQKILLATNIGKLSLTLRQAGAHSQEMVRRITESDLSVASAPPPPPAETKVANAAPAPSPPPPPVSRNATVTIIHGLKSQEYSVSQEEIGVAGRANATR